MKTVKLVQRRVWSAEVHWERSKPFVLNPRGLLVHRVQSVTEFKRDGQTTHISVHYWCGNLCNIDPNLIRESLHSNPPKGRLLCEFCEFRAVGKRQKSADQLAGRHIHRGRLRVFQTCCQHKGVN
jgi:hypothetical protein